VDKFVTTLLQLIVFPTTTKPAHYQTN